MSFIDVYTNRGVLVVVIFVFLTCQMSTVQGAAFNESCTVSSNCSEANTHCDVGSTDACVCDSSYFRNSNDACTAQIALNTACDNAETSSDQCAGTNTACQDDSANGHKCLCTTNYYASGNTCTAKIALDSTCVNGGPQDQCAAANSVCSDEGAGGHKCSCQTDFFANSNACSARVVLDGTCDNSITSADQCSVANSACSSDGTGAHKCLCSTNYEAAGGECVPQSGAGRPKIGASIIFLGMLTKLIL